MKGKPALIVTKVQFFTNKERNYIFTNIQEGGDAPNNISELIYFSYKNIFSSLEAWNPPLCHSLYSIGKSLKFQQLLCSGPEQADKAIE